MAASQDYLWITKGDISMPHLTVVPFIFSIAFGSALYGYAVEPAPDMLAQISPSILSEIYPQLPSDACSMIIDVEDDRGGELSDGLHSCSASAAELGF